jgi:hypothetical protein
MVGQVSEAAMHNASGDALVWYQQLAVAVLRRPPNIYAWTFLVLIAIPAVGMVTLVSRHLDAFTELLSHAGVAIGRTAHPARPWPRPSAPAAVEASAAGQSISQAEIIEKLAKLKALLDVGAISKDDFDKQKAKLLGRGVSLSKAVDPQAFRNLKSLLECGVLTEEEYNSHKERLLEQI